MIAISPSGERHEMTDIAAQNHMRLMEMQGQVGWSYLPDGGSPSQSTPSPVSNPLADENKSLKDQNTELTGEIQRLLSQVEELKAENAELKKKKGGRPPKDKSKL